MPADVRVSVPAGRRPSKAPHFLLSLVTPGTGHALAGHIHRGFAWALGLLALGAIAPLLMRAGFVGMVLAVALGFMALLACAFDACRVVGSRPPWRVLLPVWAILFVGGWILGDVVKAHTRRYVQAFTIPSRSMEPTLLWGDYVMADNAVYRSRRPGRGDVVVYRYPEDERRTFVGRVIAVPGDTLQVRGREVLVNGRVLDEAYVTHSLGASGDFCGYAFGCQPTAMQAGRYFVMGDNRDNSRDSRFWGFVREDAIIGRIFSIYWSWDSEAHWLRRERVGKSL